MNFKVSYRYSLFAKFADGSSDNTRFRYSIKVKSKAKYLTKEQKELLLNEILRME
jgi:hypothetical protein